MNILGDNSEVLESKLIILYFINKVKIPVTRVHIIKIMLENRFMNYFFVNQYIDELLRDTLIQSNDSDNNSVFNISSSGIDTLEMFKDQIPLGIKNRLDNIIYEIRKNIKSDTYITADYTTENENEFIVKLNIREDDFSLLELNLTVRSKEHALSIIKNFKKDPETVYTQIIKLLM